MNTKSRILSIAAALTIAGCSQGSSDSTQDNDPYLAMNTMLVKNQCSNCHGADYVRVGPSMIDVAAIRGPDSPAARKELAAKLLNGTQGAFGTAIMPAQKQINPQVADELAQAILSLKGASPS